MSRITTGRRRCPTHPARRSSACAPRTPCGFCVAAQPPLPPPQTDALAGSLAARRRQVEFAFGEAHGDAIGAVGVDLRVLERDLDRKSVEQCCEGQREGAGVDLADLACCLAGFHDVDDHRAPPTVELNAVLLDLWMAE